MKKSITTLILLLLPFSAFAQIEGDLTIYPEHIRFSQNPAIEGQETRIYATITNIGDVDLLGTVRFYDANTGTQIDSDQPISVLTGKTDDVFVDWIPIYGSYNILVTIDPWTPENDNPENNSATAAIFADYDTDNDGIGNQEDPDDDNDGYRDENDAFPLDNTEAVDTDGDNVGNNADIDDDNDGVSDNEDAFPLDHTESNDNDGDGIGDNTDLDDDNDGLSDEEELLQHTDPLNPDTDNDGMKDASDAFPNDPTETEDSDKDGIGNNKDPDDDNDGLADTLDPNDNNKGPIIAVSEIPESVAVNKEVVLSAGDSYDPDGNIRSIQWKINGEDVGEGSEFKTIFHKNGIYTIDLIVTDDKGESRTKTFKISVTNYRKYIIAGGLFLILLLALGSGFYYTKRTKRASHAKRGCA